MTMRLDTATGPADPVEYMHPPIEEGPMEQTRRLVRRMDRHADRLARHALAEAGPRNRVALALGKSESTISHEVTDRVNPELRDAFRIFLNLNGHPGVSGRAFADAVNEAIELSEIVLADTDTLLARGVHLLSQKAGLVIGEIEASHTGDGHSAVLRKLGSVLLELAAITDELATPERGSISLQAHFRGRVLS